MADLEALLIERLESAHVPGGVLVRVREGQTEVAAHGVTSLDNPLPVDADTLFQVGSVSKTFTATACARLVERGLLDLDVPVWRYLPGFHVADPDATRRVTPRMLLTHSAGFVGDFFPDTGAGDDALARAVAELAHLPQLTPAGLLRSYCNTGFNILGRLVEVLLGPSFESAVEELVLRPAGLDNTWFELDDVMTRRFVSGHLWVWKEGQNHVARPWGLPRAARPVGGVVSSAADLAAYAAWHLGGDAVLEEMRRPQPPEARGTRPWNTGLAWFVREHGGEPVVEHGGTTLGQTCQLVLVPGRRYAVAVLTNSSRGPEVFRPVIRAALAEDLGLFEPEPAPIDVEPERLDAVAGAYRGQLADYDLRRAAGELVLEHHPKGGFPRPASPPPPAMPRVRARFSASDRLLFLDPPLEGTEADVGWGPQRADWVRIGLRVCPRR